MEKWNGSSWTEVGDLNTSRFALASSSNPSSTEAVLAFGGYIVTPDGASAKCESWDGTSWSEVNDLSSVRSYLSGAGADSNSALAFGDQPVSGATEEFTTTPSALFQKTVEGQLFFNSTANSFKETITDLGAGSWASGANINTAREGTAGAGDSAEAALLVGGYTTSSPTIRVANVESWDGSSWTEVNDLNQARYLLES